MYFRDICKILITYVNTCLAKIIHATNKSQISNNNGLQLLCTIEENYVWQNASFTNLHGVDSEHVLRSVNTLFVTGEQLLSEFEANISSY